jgi:hypothetical protein
MTPAEINEAVARKLGFTQTALGWEPPPGRDTIDYGINLPVGALPDFCQDITAAWEILATLAAKAESLGTGPIIDVTHDGQWHCKIGLVVMQSDTASMAIVKAFLSLEGE